MASRTIARSGRLLKSIESGVAGRSEVTKVFRTTTPAQLAKGCRVVNSEAIPAYARSFHASTRSNAVLGKIDEEAFKKHVLNRTDNRIVLVDFFAVWCGPCKFLTPVLEEATQKAGVDMVTLDVDEFPELAAQYSIRAMPTVIAFKNGKPVSQFVGALPPPKVQQFISDCESASNVSSGSASSKSSTPSGSTPGGSRSYTTYSRASPQRRALSTSASSGADGVEGVSGWYNDLVETSKSLPRDPLRSNLQLAHTFEVIARQAFGQAPTSKAAADANAASMTPQQKETVEKALKALKSLKDDENFKTYPLTDKTLAPQTDPLYYTRLLQGVQLSSQGKARSWWKQFFQVKGSA